MPSNPSTASGTGSGAPAPPTTTTPVMLPSDTVIRLSKWMGDKFYLVGKVASARNRKVKRGYVYWCEFGENIGSEQCRKRPAIVLQNDPANDSSPNVIVAPITNTSRVNGSIVPLSRAAGSPLTGHVLLGNIVTVSKARLGGYIDKLDPITEMPLVEKALYNSLGVAAQIEKTEKQLERTTKHLADVKTTRNEAIDSLRDIRKALALPTNADRATILKEIEKLQNPEETKGI